MPAYSREGEGDAIPLRTRTNSDDRRRAEAIPTRRKKGKEGVDRLGVYLQRPRARACNPRDAKDTSAGSEGVSRMQWHGAVERDRARTASRVLVPWRRAHMVGRLPARPGGRAKGTAHCWRSLSHGNRPARPVRGTSAWVLLGSCYAGARFAGEFLGQFTVSQLNC